MQNGLMDILKMKIKGRISPKSKKYIQWATGFCVLITRDIENQIRIEVSHVNIRNGKQVAPFLHEIDCLQSRVSCKTSTNKIVQNPVFNCFSHRFDYPFIKILCNILGVIVALLLKER